MDGENELFEAFGLPLPEESPAPEGGGEGEGQGAALDTTGAGDGGQGGAPGAPEGTGGESGQQAGAAETPATAPGAPQTAPAAPAPTPPAAPAPQAQPTDPAPEQVRGKVNPYTQQPILTRADLDAYLVRHQEEQRKAQLERLAAAGLTPEMITGIVDQHPVVQQAQQVLREMREEQARAVQARSDEYYAGQLKEIAALAQDPEIKTLEDLQRKNPEQFGVMLQRQAAGVPMADTYRALNFDALAARRAEAAKQAAVNQVTGKGHMGPVGGGGKPGVEVPADVMEQFMALAPDMTAEQARKAYAEYQRAMGN